LAGEGRSDTVIGKNTSPATEAEVEAAYAQMHEAFVNAPDIATFRANLVAQVEAQIDDPLGLRRMIAVVEYDADVFVIGGLTFSGTLTLYKTLEGAIKGSLEQAAMLVGPGAGEA
jgi:hypothetical protein